MKRFTRATLVAALSGLASLAHGQQSNPPRPEEKAVTLPTITVNASADASAQGLSPAYPGGQVARGGRAGVLGTRDNMETPFSITAYTNELIQDRQAKSVGEVLQNDPGVRVARGFGNFQETYFIRGFLLSSDDVAYNGLYSLLPRQYIATELFERVEVLRGASAFLTGANPGGGGLGGAINLLPKRAPNDPLTRATLGGGSGGQGSLAADIARRFGPDGSTGVRINAAYRDGGTGVDDEKVKLGLGAIGLDWRGRGLRLSGDLGWQDNRLKQTRPNVGLGFAETVVPRAPDSSANFAQPWSYSNERDLFGTLRGEYDLGANATLWAAYGMRRSEEANSLANLDLASAATGAATTSRFDNTREDRVDTGEVGLRGKARTGSVSHEWVAAAAFFEDERKNAYAWDFFNTIATNLYAPVSAPRRDFSSGAFRGNILSDPALTGRTRLSSVAVGDTMGFSQDSILVTLGARQQKLKVENFAYDTGAASPAYDESRVSPMAGVVFKLSPKVSLYANYVEGLTQGDTAPANTANVGEMLAPYVSKQKEAGLKLDSGRLGLGAAVFTTDRPRSFVNGAGVFAAEGRDRHRGAELSIYGVAFTGVRVLGGVTWLDAKQASTGTAGLDGKRVIGVPRLQASLGAEWDLPRTGISFDARVVHTGSSFADGANTLEIPGWTRLDIGARYVTELRGKPLTLRARIDNLTDRDYWASVGGYPGIGYLVAGAPRTLVVSASMDF